MWYIKRSSRLRRLLATCLLIENVVPVQLIMNSITLVCLVGFFAVALSLPSEQYTDKYDSINVDEILENPRLMEPFKKCVLDQGKCSPEGKELRGHIGDALETACSKCTPKQKTETEKVIKHLINKDAETWNQLKEKYDPSKKFVTKYEKELKEISP